MATAPDPSRCPLCGTPNGCAMVAGTDTGSCWCASVEIPTEVLDRIPDEAQGKACVCATCAKGATGGVAAARPLRTVAR